MPQALNPDLYGLKNESFYRTFSERRDDLPGTQLNLPFRPIPGTVVAYCENHTGIPFDPRFETHGEIRTGRYPFVREDTSVGVARSEAMEVAYYDFDARTWCADFGANCGYFERFPSEPWPPVPEG